MTQLHARTLRILHWLNLPFLFLMIWSGVLIYWANDIYPGFFPEWFYEFFKVGQRLAEGMSVHFLVGWLFVINGLIYLVWFFCSGHWREVFPSRETFKLVLPTILHDVGLKTEMPPQQGRFNAVQRLAYTGILVVAALAVLSGFAIYKPVQLSWLTSLFGGYEGARLIHFAMMIAFCLFVFLHVVQVIRAGWNNFTAMIGQTAVSFGVFFLAAVVVIAVWKVMWHQPLVDDAPKPFRQTLELNGKIWKALFNSSRLTLASTPPVGKVPRVNGLIGLTTFVDPTTWKMEVVTNAADPASRRFNVTLKELMTLPRTDTATEFRCIEGWSEDMAFAGVKFSDFIKAYNIEKKPYVGLSTVDGEYYVSIDIESMMHEQTLLAYEMNGMPLSQKNGSPLRLAIPIKYGIKSIKQIGRIIFSDTRPPDYWAEAGYDWHAGL